MISDDLSPEPVAKVQPKRQTTRQVKSEPPAPPAHRAAAAPQSQPSSPSGGVTLADVTQMLGDRFSNCLDMMMQKDKKKDKTASKKRKQKSSSSSSAAEPFDEEEVPPPEELASQRRKRKAESVAAASQDVPKTQKDKKAKMGEKTRTVSGCQRCNRMESDQQCDSVQSAWSKKKRFRFVRCSLRF